MTKASRYRVLFKNFCESNNSLQVYYDEKLVYSSTEKMLLPLLQYIEGMSSEHRQVAVFDKIVGNAAALLLVIAGCSEVYSPLGSELAVDTLVKYGIRYHIEEIVPFITRPGTEAMCPMEKLSLGKTPESFYDELKQTRG
jgi:hypothetical protein